MSEKRFKSMQEVDEYLEKQIQDDEKRCVIDTIQAKNVTLVNLLNSLSEENEQLKSRIAFFEEQEDEFEKYTAQTIQNMIANYKDD